MTEKPKLYEILQHTVSVAETLGAIELQIKGLKVELEETNMKLKTRCMAEDLQDLEER